MNPNKKKSVRVAILVENLPVPNDRRVWQEAKTLTAAECQVFIVSITGPGATKQQELREGIRIFRYPAPPKTHGLISFLWEFSYCWIMSFILTIWIACRYGLDIIHACNPPETFWLIGMIFKPFGVRFLFDHHDLSPEMYLARFGKKGAAFQALLLLEAASFRTANAVIFSNSAQRDVVIQRGYVDPNRSVVLLSVPDHRQMVADEPDLTIKNGRTYLLCYVGVLNPQDGGETLIWLTDYLIRQRHFENFTMAILGDGDDRTRMQELACKLGVQQHIQFTGWADAEMMRRYLSTADLCLDCMPKNSYSETAMLNKILEYMSYSRPIAMFDLKQSHWAAGEAAWYAPTASAESLADGIIELLADPQRRARMGIVGRQRIINILNWEKQKENLFTAYNWALEGKRSRTKIF